MQIIVEARSKYGNDHIIINEGSEDDPNWKLVHKLPKGSGGIREEDIFDRWR
ncbi:TPA: cytoplasmic protein [Bacillus wiedmannii]|nr:cytoplasmic protein [Bacillus wiedmannii]